MAGGFGVQATTDDAMVELWLRQYRSPNTRRAYGMDIRSFRSFRQCPFREVTVRDCQDFAEWLETRLSEAAQARRLSAVKSLFALAHRLGYLPYDVAAVIMLPTVKDTLAERIMSEEDVQRMLWLTKKPTHAALIRLIYSAGLRISEVCSLRWRDVAKRQEGGQLTVYGKGGKTRTVLLTVPIWNRLAKLKGRSKPDDPIFRGKTGRRPITVAGVHSIVKQAARRARLSRAVSTHWLRHAHVSHALDHGAPIHVVRATVGHASLETTTRYSHVRPDDSSSKYITA